MSDLKTIKHSNILTSAHYDYSAYEINLLMLLCQAVNSYPSKQDYYTISLRTFIDKSEISSGAMGYIKNASKKLRSKSLEFFDTSSGVYIITGIIDLIEIEPNSDKIRMYVNHRMYPLLNELKKEFTTIDINSIFRLKRKHSKRFYQFLRQFVQSGLFVITLEDLKKRLLLDKGYDKFSHFNSRVLIPAIKEINQYTSMNVSFDVVKRGRSVEQIRFYISLPAGQLDLIERENENLHQRLSRWNFAPWFIDNIINTLGPESIHTTCYAVELAIANKIPANNFAYARQAFLNAGVPEKNIMKWDNR